jgi:polyisoprenoid-binding protein YceI
MTTTQCPRPNAHRPVTSVTPEWCDSGVAAISQDAPPCWRPMPDGSIRTAGRWVIDPDRSRVRFAVRRRGLAPLRASFTSMSGHVETSDVPPGASLELEVVTASIVSGSARCDLRAAEHLDVARHPTATFRATSTSWASGRARFRGWLTIVGVTNEVALDVHLRSTVVDASGVARRTLFGACSIDRESFGLSWNITLADGRALVEPNVDLEFELEAVRQPTPPSPSTSSDSGRH